MTEQHDSASRTATTRPPTRRSSSQVLVTLLKTAAVVFAAEFAVMEILDVLSLQGTWAHVADSLMLTILLLPMLYWLGIRSRGLTDVGEAVGRRFRLFRHAVFVSSCAIVGILLIVGFGLRGILRENVLSEATRDAEHIAAALRAVELESLVQTDPDGRERLGIDPERFAQVDTRIRSFLAAVDVLKIKVFDPDTRIIYSTDPKVIGQWNRDNAHLAAALRGATVSKLESKDSALDLSGEQRFDVNLVETYLPVFGTKGQVAGSFEIYKDVTPYLRGASESLILFVTALFFALMAAFSILGMMMHRASRAVRAHTADLKCTNERFLTEITQRQQADEQLRENNAMMVDALEREKRISWQLETANAEAEEALIKLEHSQSQLLQADKMASIGHLAAGVAHEINNPIGFISSNLNSLGQYVEDLKSVLAAHGDLLRQCASHADLATLAAQVQRVREEKDIDYVLSDLGNLLGESIDGAQRVRQIVADLRDFSHVDNPDVAEEDVNGLLDKTINVAWNELKYKTEVVREYGEIPTIPCYGGKLGQVFLNLLVNASQAIEEHGTITVRTRREDDSIRIEVIDTGRGIPPESLSRIFDPFFTTKDVGEGTGLGLHLTHTIIQAHGGRISVESTVGEGTTFHVELPMSGPPSAAVTSQEESA